MAAGNLLEVKRDNLFPFQLEAVSRIERQNGRALLAFDMGLGKTVISLSYLRRNPEALPAVVVCPAAVKYQWRKESIRWLGIEPLVIEGRKPFVSERVPLVIINYDILPYHLDSLQSLDPKTVIVDECHYISNPRAKRSKAVRSLAYRRPHVLALSGTPMLNRPIELFNTIQMIWPWEWKSRWEYAQRYCNPRWTPWGWKYDGAANIEELHRKLVQSGMIRKRKESVLKELPPKFREAIPLPMENEQEYYMAERDFLAWLASIDPEAAVRAKRAEGITRIGYLLRLAARLKFPYLMGWINERIEHDLCKMVVFAVHKRMIEMIQKGAKCKSVIVDGSTSGEERQRRIEQFQSDSEVRLFIGQLQAAGMGINLTAANTVVFAEMDWVPSRFLQAEDRAHRIGTGGTVWCYYMIAKDTVEERLCEIIQQKQHVVSSILDGENISELNVYDLLLEHLRGKQDGGNRFLFGAESHSL